MRDEENCQQNSAALCFPLLTNRLGFAGADQANK